MDALSNLAMGMGVALLPANLLCMLAGGLLGMVLGLLPGVGPVAAMALLLPVSATLAPLQALTLLAALYAGARHGRSIAAILVQAPGDAELSDQDGKQLARQGQGALALAAEGLGSFVTACVLTLLLAVCAPRLAALALAWGPVERFALLVLVLTGCAMLAWGSRLKALAMVVLGLLLGLVGGIGGNGVVRFAFGVAELEDGIGLVVLAVGVFAFGEIIANLAQAAPARQVFGVPMQGFRPGRQLLRQMGLAVLRGTALGALLGLLPGGGARMSAFAALVLEKKIAARPGEAAMGSGNIRAVVAPGCAGQAGAQTGFLPLLALGLPTNAVMVLLLGAMGMHKLRPGPQLISSQPALFWGLLASLLLGKLLLVLLSLPLKGLWSRLIRLPYRWLFPLIVLCGTLGVYSLHHSMVDVWLLAGFGLAGYVFSKLGMVPAPLLLGFVLAPAMEENLQQALLLSQGDWSVFVTHPLSAGLLLAALCMLLVLPAVRARHKAAFVEE